MTTNIYQQNILAMWLQANSQERVAGRQWYRTAHTIVRELAEKYNESVTKVAAVVAALSPNNKWEKNIVDAETVLAAYQLGYGPDDVKVSTYSLNKKKAFEILALNPGDDVLTILKGNKVQAFFSNISTPNISSDVCVDGHAYAIHLGARVPISKTPRLTDNQYARIANDYREVAKELGVLPHVLQATTWVVYKNIHNI